MYVRKDKIAKVWPNLFIDSENSTRSFSRSSSFRGVPVRGEASSTGP